MRFAICILAALFSLPLSASTLQVFYEVESLGGNAYRYTYTLENYSFLADQELAIEFPPDDYGTISNGTPSASLDWDLLLFQPDDPPGSVGLYSLYALVDNPTLAEVFSVEFIWLGAGAPGSQPFSLNQWDPDGDFLDTLQTGVTQLRGGTSDVPEPGSAALLLIGALLMFAGTRLKPILIRR